MNHKRWHILPPVPRGHPLGKCGLPPLVTQILFNRGLGEPSQVEPFLRADKRLSSDPFLLPDMEVAVTRIYRAMLGGEKIAIYGDFDADGITSTALLIQGLKAFNIQAVPYIPHRMNEGHGLKIAAVESLHKEGVSLIITTDCGITGINPVKKAHRLGIDVIITDHHTPTEELPPALALVNPKRTDSHYPFIELAGVGVAYKLLQALLMGVNKESQLDEVTDLVALGTVADMTPLLGENRYLVNEGLKRMNASLRLGLGELMTSAGLKHGCLTSENITWSIAPRINTASRLDHALPSYELLTTDSIERAKELTDWLEQKNTERQQMVARATTMVKEQVIAAPLTPLIMVRADDFSAGISGLVANRLTDEFYRPTVVIRAGKKISTGSCRSIPEFNIIDALTQCRDLFVEYGGHKGAAGFMILTHNLDHLYERLMKLAETRLAGVDLRPKIDIDAEVSLRDLAGNAYRAIQQLAPFGQANPQPVLLSRKVRVVSHRTMGNNSGHLRLKLEQDGMVWDAVAFGFGSNQAELSEPLDIVYNLELDQWNNKSTLRLNLLDFAKAN
ncbi:MAG: single-stranded-DNA-specific exonuclease RecJ [Dehalococcoidales bacterium]|nr:single-stranded-DNA-specific exonuclease RecJ [Dehalococcoidales bacterium]